MKIGKHILLFILGIAVASCANRDLTKDATVYSEAEFGSFKTWSWHIQEQDESVNPIIHNQVKTKIAQELKEKGLVQKSEDEDVDFHVNYIVNVRNDLKVENLNSYEGYSERYIGLDRYGRHVNVTEFQLKKGLEESQLVETIVKGTLIVDILDPKTNKLLMRMITEKPLPEHKVDTETRQARINTAIEELLEYFPPKEK